jgi:hypothetical protein
MLKRLNVLAILLSLGSTLLFAGVPAPSPGGKAKPKHVSHAQDKDANASAPDTTPSPAPSAAPPAQSATPAAQNPAAAAPTPQDQTTPAKSGNVAVSAPTTQPLQVQAELQKDWRDKLDWILCAALVLIALAAVWLVRKSLKTVESLLGEIKSASARAERTVDHIGRQCEAALLTAKSVARADRAWIVVSVESPERDRYIFRARNVGKTPARITAIGKFNTAVNNGRSKFKIAPEYERPEGQIAIQPFFLPPTASCIVFDYNLKGMGVDRTADGESKVSAIYSYGRVIYSDVADTTSVHETRWFYIKIPSEDTLPFPDPLHPEYNSYA